MLKYAAFALILIAGYMYFDRPSKSQAAALPQIPKTRSVVVPKTPRRPIAVAPAKSSTGMASTAPTLQHNKDKVYTYPELQKIIVNDDICALNKIVSEISSKGETPIYIDALFEALNIDNYKDIFGIEGPLFKAQDGKTLSPQQKFVDALVTSELLYGGKREQFDQDKSLKQLEELTAAFPDNAAYATYKLALEAQMGKTSAQLRSTAAQAAKAKVYDTGLHDVKAALQKHMWDSPTVYHLTRVVMGEMPNARFGKVRDAIEGVSDQKFEEHLGNLLVQKGLNSKRTYMSAEFDTTEYYYGNHFLDKKHPDAEELAELREPGKMQEINESWVHYNLDVNDCDRTALDESFSKMKNRY